MLTGLSEITSAQFMKPRFYSNSYTYSVFPYYLNDLVSNPFSPLQLNKYMMNNQKNFPCTFQKVLLNEKTNYSNRIYLSHNINYKDFGITSGTRFNPQGVKEEWIYTLDHPVPAYDWASDVAVDDSCNIYVTGYTTNIPNGMDFLTIKYDPDGAEIWRRVYDGESHGDDFAKQIIIDAYNNLIVAGYDNEGLLIVKYDSGGQLIWHAHFTSADNEQDIFRDMIVDRQGNIYLLSTSLSVIKFSPDGVQLWASQLNVQVTSDIFHHLHTDYSRILIDSQQNIYITCSTEDIIPSNDQYLTVGEIWIFKYGTSGNHIWTKSYSISDLTLEYLHSSAMDLDDNLYLSGISRNNLDWNSDNSILLKSDSEGNLVWSKTDQSFGFTNITVDKYGNLFRTAGIKLDKYDPYGKLNWSKQLDDFRSLFWHYRGGEAFFVDIMIDNLDNIILTGVRDKNIAFAKISAEGDILGNSSFQQPASHWSWPNAYCINKKGQVIITGSLLDTMFYNYDYLTIKYNLPGEADWFKSFNGNDTQLGETHYFGLDMFDNVYISGFNGEQHILTKIDPQGIVNWTQEIDELWPINMETDGWGNCYFLYPGFKVIKRNNEGQLLWQVQFDGSHPQSLYLDQLGNTYVFGSGYAEDNQGMSVNYITVIKLDQNGILKWQENYRGYSLDDYYVNSNGDVFFSGYT